MEKDSKMFLKRSAYHVSKARDLDSALQKSKGVEEALNRLKNIQADYQKEALLAANKAMAKNYGFNSLHKLVKFMSEMAELPKSKRNKIIKTVDSKLLKNKPQRNRTKAQSVTSESNLNDNVATQSNNTPATNTNPQEPPVNPSNMDD